MKTGRVLLKIYVFRWIFFSLFAVNLTEGRVTPRIFSLAKTKIFSSSSRFIPGPVKEYTGIRISHDSALWLNYHEQTVAVVEVGLNGTLINCELLEVRTEADQRAAIDTLRPYVDKVTEIQFEKMIDLMSSCHQLDPPFNSDNEFMDEDYSHIDPRQFTTLFSGVFPGTKWCGSGDLASSYYDLGPNWKVDKCCRTHDFCPVKIPGFKTQYGLTNYAFYTSSHCTCDKFFFACLRYTDTTTSNLLGGIFFNLNPNYHCIEDVLTESYMSKPTKKFQKFNMRF